MSGEEAGATPCARVLECLVGGGDVRADRALAEHLGSCVICFRASTELRDAPRLALALRGAAATAPAPALPDGFWDALAQRTTAAATAALRGRDRLPASRPSRARGSAGGGRWTAVSARARVALLATSVAAAAVLMIVARRPPAALSARLPAARVAAAVASAARSAPDDGATDDGADVADLDGTALRRLLDRLRTTAPTVLTSFGGEPSEAGDALGDDDRRVNDELADLDGTALRRVASSLGANPL